MKAQCLVESASTSQLNVFGMKMPFTPSFVYQIAILMGEKGI